jgi:hypothetical protein
LLIPASIPINAINQAAKAIDSTLRSGAFEAARDKADRFIFGAKFMKENKKLFAGLRRDLRAARKRRY